MAGGGTKLPRSSPHSSSSASQAASATSVLRPGRSLPWRAPAQQQRKPALLQHLPDRLPVVAGGSSTTRVTPSAVSQSASASSSALKVANVRIACRRWPPAPASGVRTHATTSC
jgi:hypothetical protein